MRAGRDAYPDWGPVERMLPDDGGGRGAFPAIRKSLSNAPGMSSKLVSTTVMPPFDCDPVNGPSGGGELVQGGLQDRLDFRLAKKTLRRSVPDH